MLAEVSVPFEQCGLCEGVLTEILRAYLARDICVERHTDLNSDVDLHWLSFAYENTHFSIALNHEWKKASGLLSLLQWMEFQKKQSNQFLLRHLPKNFSEADRFEVLKFQCRDGNEYFNAWFRLERGFELPEFEKITRNSWKIKISVSVNLAIEVVPGQVVLSDPQIVFHLSDVIPKAGFNLSARLLATKNEQTLKLEDYDMNENTTLRTSLRLGALEFKLEELLSLKSGSEVTFTLPESTAVELELAGQIIGKGELRIAEQKFILGISEVFNR